jgi:hypothetical protein
MRWRSLALILCVAWAGPGMAQTPQPRPFPWLGIWTSTKTCPSIGCCADDYCRKPCPGILPISRCGTLDDYCRKPMPCVLDVLRCGSCDDYCRKMLPGLLCPPQSPGLRCTPCEIFAPAPTRR